MHGKLLSQDVFISTGKIEFEKRVNLYKNLDDQSSGNDGGFDWTSQLKKSLPEYQVTYFNLTFDNNKTLYKAGREVVQSTHRCVGGCRQRHDQGQQHRRDRAARVSRRRGLGAQPRRRLNVLTAPPARRRPQLRA